MPSLSLPDASLYFERAGTGPKVLLINGTGSDLRNQPNPFAWPLGQACDLCAYDHRGLGRSRPGDPTAQPTMQTFADDALALVDHLGWESFAVVGVSFGGMVAQHLALTAQSRLSHLVLCCTSSGGAGGSSAPLHEYYQRTEPERSELLASISDRRVTTDPAIAAQLARFRRPLPDPLPIGLRAQLEARRYHDTYERLPAISAETLVAAGRFDDIAPLANSEALARHIPNARLDVFDGGHLFLFQDSRAWPTVLTFLGAREGQ